MLLSFFLQFFVIYLNVRFVYMVIMMQLMLLIAYAGAGKATFLGSKIPEIFAKRDIYRWVGGCEIEMFVLG